MKNLQELTNEELLTYYEEMREYERLDYEIGCCDIVTKAWRPIWEAFEKEFEKRKITEGE
jgi:hypothetical protein